MFIILEDQCAAEILSVTWFEIIVISQANIGGSLSQLGWLRLSTCQPWNWAVNPDYEEVCNILLLPEDPVWGQVLDHTLKPLAFAASMSSVASPATPITSPVVAGTRCTVVQHDGAYAACRQTQPQVAPVATSNPSY